MAQRRPTKRRKDRRTPDTRPSAPRKPKRSLEGPLWLIGAAVLIGFPMVRDATADKMQRNTYANASSCHCAYSASQCRRDEDQWVGPWYASYAEDRSRGR